MVGKNVKQYHIKRRKKKSFFYIIIIIIISKYHLIKKRKLFKNNYYSHYYYYFLCLCFIYNHRFLHNTIMLASSSSLPRRLWCRQPLPLFITVYTHEHTELDGCAFRRVRSFATKNIATTRATYSYLQALWRRTSYRPLKHSGQ